MSYTDDTMRNLAYELRETKQLKKAIERFNSNIEVLDRLAKAIEKQNELKEIELGIKGNTKTLTK